MKMKTGVDQYFEQREGRIWEKAKICKRTPGSV